MRSSAFNVRALLVRNPALASCAEPVLDRLAATSRVGVHDAGELIAAAGQPQAEVLLLASGQVELLREDHAARTRMLVALLDPPALIGEGELYSGSVWIATARARSECVTVQIPNATFDWMIETDPAIARSLYKSACTRQLLATELMQVFALQRTEHMLLRLLEASAAGAELVRISQIELADALGVVPKTIARHLATLEAAGYISRAEDGVRVLGANRAWKRLTGGGMSWCLPSRAGS